MTDVLDPVSVAARDALSIGGPDQTLDDQAIGDFVAQCLAAEDLDGRSVW